MRIVNLLESVLTLHGDSYFFNGDSKKLRKLRKKLNKFIKKYWNQGYAIMLPIVSFYTHLSEMENKFKVT